MRALAIVAGGLLALADLGAAGCRQPTDVALAIHELEEAGAALADPQLDESQVALLDCQTAGASLAALCIEVYTTAGARTTIRATCHDAPQVQVGGPAMADAEEDLKAYLRGLGSLADGIAMDEANINYVRLIGYPDATRANPNMCGISAAFPQHLDRSTAPPSLPTFLLCRPAAGNLAEQIFEDYCGAAGFVTLVR